MRGQITLIGCPKLDEVDYSEKLTEIIRAQRHPERDRRAHGGPLLRRIGAWRPSTALKNSGKFIPWQVVTVSVDGRLKED